MWGPQMYILGTRFVTEGRRSPESQMYAQEESPPSEPRDTTKDGSLSRNKMYAQEGRRLRWWRPNPVRRLSRKERLDHA